MRDRKRDRERQTDRADKDRDRQTKIGSYLLLSPEDSSLKTTPSSWAKADPNLPPPALNLCSCRIFAMLESPWNWGSASALQLTRPTYNIGQLCSTDLCLVFL